MSLKQFIARLPWALFVLSVTVLVAGVVISLQQKSDNAQAAKQTATSITAPSTGKPAQSDFDNYTVAADMPRYISIPKINVRAVVRPLGLINDGRLASPANVYDAGWFNQSSKPGQAGAMVVDGHVSSRTTKGVFYSIDSLRAGDKLQIELGDGTKITYTVVTSQTYDATNVDMRAVLNPVNQAKPGLNLITCAGSVTKGTNEFDKRIVIFAEQN